MNFSVNQNRKLYVATAAPVNAMSGLTGAGKIFVQGVGPEVSSKQKNLVIYHTNKLGEATRSDLIRTDCIFSIHCSAPEDSATKLKAAIVVLDPSVNSGAPILGQDYVLRIQLRQYFGMSDEDIYIKDVAVRATSAMVSDASKFYAALKTELEKSFSRELVTPFTITSSATGLTLTEKLGDYNRGTMRETSLQFDIFPTEVIWQGEDVIWGKVIMSGATTCTDGSAIPVGITAPSVTTSTYKNSRQLADLEYFCAGEVGDQYRMVCWPNYVPTSYLIDEASTSGYYVIDMHFAYRGDGMENQFSEKTITIACTTQDIMDAVIEDIVGVNSDLTDKVTYTESAAPEEEDDNA